MKKLLILAILGSSVLLGCKAEPNPVCGQLEDPNWQTECLNSSRADQDRLQAAFISGDFFVCMDFENEILSEYCMQTVLSHIQEGVLQQIIEIGDPANCENLKNPTFKERCIAELGT